MKRIISGLLRRQTSFSQATQAAAYHAVQAPQSDKFEDPLYRQFQVPVIRMVRERGMTQGPATVLIGDVPTDIFSAGSVGIMSFENIDKEGFINNAFSVMGFDDEEQFKMTVPALARQYQKAHERFEVKIHPHNEFITKGRNAVLCVTDVAKLEEAKKIGKTLGREFEDAEICYYERSEGKIYHIEDGRKAEEIILPRNILSLSNMALNEEMQRFVNRAYDQAVSNAADKIIEERNGVMMSSFCNQNEVNRIFRNDVAASIKEKISASPALQVKVKEGKKVSPADRPAYYQLSNH